MRVVRAILALARATHPLPATAVTGLTAGLLVTRGVRGAALAWAVASTAAGQASVGWSNDLLDRHEDAKAGREEKPIVAGEIEPRTVAIAAIAAGAACPLLGLPLGAGPAALMAVAVASAWLYNAGLKRTIWSWAPYAASFGLLPVFVWRVADERAPALVAAGGIALGVAAHLMNVVPDLEADAAFGHRGLPHRLGPRASVAVAAGLLVGAIFGGFAAGDAGRLEATLAAAGSVCALAAAATAWRGHPRLGFRLTIAAAAAAAGLVALAG